MEKLIFQIKKIQKYLYLPLWYLFRLKNNYVQIAYPKKMLNAVEDKEKIIPKILSLNTQKSFLEIGIGQFPNIERMKLLNKLRIKYLGLDFDYVCSDHKKELKLSGLLNKNIKYRGNKRGTYAWTLYELMKNENKYDLIYLDGHHTFYTDLPVVFLINQLLKPQGILMVDDLNWTLSFLKDNMFRCFIDWYFYNKIYDFSFYDEIQQRIPHIRMIVENVLITKYRYKILSQYQGSDFIVLRKPKI